MEKDAQAVFNLKHAWTPATMCRSQIEYQVMIDARSVAEMYFQLEKSSALGADQL